MILTTINKNNDNNKGKKIVKNDSHDSSDKRAFLKYFINPLTANVPII